MSFSKFDACSATPAIARIKRHKRRILTPKKLAHSKPIAVLKIAAQSERYVGAIQSLIEKVSNSYDFSPRIGSNICKSKSMKCLTTSIHRGGGLRLGLLRRERSHDQLHAFFHSPAKSFMVALGWGTYCLFISLTATKGPRSHPRRVTVKVTQYAST